MNHNLSSELIAGINCTSQVMHWFVMIAVQQIIILLIKVDNRFLKNLCHTIRSHTGAKPLHRQIIPSSATLFLRQSQLLLYIRLEFTETCWYIIRVLMKSTGVPRFD